MDTPTAEAWQANTNPHQLVSWSRRVGNSRKFLLLGCAVVRHGLGVKSELGEGILATIEEHARLRTDKKQPGPRLVAGLLAPKFPGVFRTDMPWRVTDTGQRQLGTGEVRWVWLFVQYADNPQRVTKALPNELIQLAASVARDAAGREVVEEIETIRRELAAAKPAKRGFLRRTLRSPPAAPTVSPSELSAAVLARHPDLPRGRLPPTWAPEFTRAWAHEELRYHLREQRAVDMKAVLSGLVREVFGDPFRPWHVHPDWPAANGGAARAVANHIARTGDFAALPILADALEDAGCTDAAALDHCRGGGPHVAGCWVMDRVLGW